MVFEVEAVFENVKISSWNWLNVKNKEFWVFLILVALVVFVLGTHNHIEAEWPRCGWWLILNLNMMLCLVCLKALHIITEECNAWDEMMVTWGPRFSTMTFFRQWNLNRLLCVLFIVKDNQKKMVQIYTLIISSETTRDSRHLRLSPGTWRKIIVPWAIVQTSKRLYILCVLNSKSSIN
jgi:hypothetical protein